MNDKDLIRRLDEQLHAVQPDPNFKIQPLKRPPRYGVFLQWPEEGHDWIHEEDVELANLHIPSHKVFRREDLDDEFTVLTYGDVRIRVRPAMWLEIEHEGYEIGDTVEIKSDFGRQKPLIAKLDQVLWNPKARRIEYVLKQEGRILNQRSIASDFRMVLPINETPSNRQRAMAERDHLR